MATFRARVKAWAGPVPNVVSTKAKGCAGTGVGAGNVAEAVVGALAKAVVRDKGGAKAEVGAETGTAKKTYPKHLPGQWLRPKPFSYPLLKEAVAVVLATLFPGPIFGLV